MYNAAGLIPSRFLILISHFVICVTLLWSRSGNNLYCFPNHITQRQLATTDQHTEIVLGLGLAVGMLGLEALIFLFGLTMFHSSSALLSIACHSSASIILCYFIFDSWRCGWFWWIFGFGSVLPILYDCHIVLDVICKKKY